MATVLDRQLKRLVTIDGAEYTVVLDPDGVKLVGKGKRKPEAELRWSELLSGEAALAAALNASLVKKTPRPTAPPAAAAPPARAPAPSPATSRSAAAVASTAAPPPSHAGPAAARRSRTAGRPKGK